MKRRDFLKQLGIGALALAFPRVSYPQNQLEYPLQSLPDVGTQLNEQMAAKARKVAEYIITRDTQRGLLSVDPKHRLGTDYQGVQAVMKIDGWRYSVWVANHDENARFTMRDLLSVWMRPEGTYGQSKLITFSDEGMDGHCDLGIIPEGLSETGQSIVYRAPDRFNPNPEGVEHKDRFQDLYNKTLDKVIAFYERE